MKPTFIFFLLSILLLLSACSSTPKVIPLKVYSEPAGAYVIYRISRTSTDAPWVYLGTTPLESALQLNSDMAKNSSKLSVRVMKEGYFDIKKEWDAEKLKKESKQRKMLFWNPSLVEHQVR
ncbi:MAG: hypothetical protein GXP23_04100 [Gammaproteobacteria bacterium]|nr:hypothetical protein [Gammaproteobacteria bacterium]